MTYRRCRSCRAFFDKALPACDQCGAEPYAYNKSLYAGKLNNALFAQAARAKQGM